MTGSFRTAPDVPRPFRFAAFGDMGVTAADPRRRPDVEAPSGATVRAQRDGTTYVLPGGGGQAAYPSALHPTSYVTVEPGLRIPEAAPWSAVRFLDNSLGLVDVTPRAPGARRPCG